MNKLGKYTNQADKIKIPNTMKATVLSGAGFENIAIREVPVPEPGPDQLLARVDAAGVCTSILKIIEQGKKHKYLYGWDPGKWPLIMGDEGSVTIVKVGNNLKGKYSVGKKYGLQPAVDYHPINHLERYDNNGRDVKKMGVGYTLPGQLAQYVLIQEEVLEAGCLIELPDESMPYFSVSMAEPVSCVVSSQTRNVHIYKDSPVSPRYAKLGLKKGGVTIIVGAGSMGKIHVELAMRYNPGILIVNDVVKERLDWVNKVLKPKADKKGIRLITLTPEKLDIELPDITDGNMADDIIMAVGIKEVQQKAIEWLGFGGVINLFGGLPKGDSILNVDNIKVHYEEIKVIGSSGGDTGDYIETLHAINNNDIEAGNYVAAVGSIENAVKVLRMIKEGRIQGKAILYPHIKEVGLTMVDRWSNSQEKDFLERNLNDLY